MFGTPKDTGLTFAAATVPSRHVSDIVRTQANNLGSRSSPSTLLTTRTRQALVQTNCGLVELLTFRDNDTYLQFPEANPYLNSLLTWNDFYQEPDAHGNVILFRELPEPHASRHLTAMVFGTTSPPSRHVLASGYACTVDATWTSVTLNASRGDDFNRMTHVLNDHYDGSIPSSQIIHMPSAWTERVRAAMFNSSPILGAPHEGIANIEPEKLFAFILSNSDYAYLKCTGGVLECDMPWCQSDVQSKALCSYLNKIKAWKRYFAVSESVNAAWSDPAVLTYQVVAQYQQGYGYDASDITIQLSLAVIGLYCGFAVVHIRLLLITGYTGTSWDSISELLMLGLMSRTPTHLQCVSVGVEAMKTFREPVSIRINDAGGVELVFEDEPGAKIGRQKEVEDNKSY